MDRRGEKDARTHLQERCAHRGMLRRDARAQGAYAHHTSIRLRDAVDSINDGPLHVRDTRDNVQRVLQGQTSIKDEEGKYKVLT